ncbi:hypothetical protein AK812_SmicGene38504, partial [Symbiodinium microadriaticum]
MVRSILQQATDVEELCSEKGGSETGRAWALGLQFECTDVNANDRAKARKLLQGSFAGRGGEVATELEE